MKHSGKYSGYKKVPSFWWDFDSDLNFVIQSDHPDYPVITTVKLDYYDELSGDNSKTLYKAEQLIKDMEEGRLDFRKVAKNGIT